MAAPLATMVADVDGLPVHARVALGHAPPGRTPLVLVHGLSISSAYMAPLAQRLAGEFPVYAPDLPGFGLSGKPDEVLDVPGLARALVSWMDAAGLSRASLAANSLGCQVVVEAAARRPERVERLVLVGPTCDPCVRRPRVVLALLRDAVREDPGLLALHVADDVRAGPRRIVRTFRHALRHPMALRLRELRMPVLVVRGEDDPLTSRRWAREVARRAPRGGLLELPGVPHAANYTAPDALAEAILPFLLGRADPSPRRGGA